MKRLAILFSTLLLVTAAAIPAMAGDRTLCVAGDYECPTPSPSPTPSPTPTLPPPEPTPTPSPTPTPTPTPPPTADLSVNAFAIVCGDPRLWVRTTNKGEVATQVRVTFVRGNKDKPALRKSVVRNLGVGKTRVIGPRWVRGPVKVQVKAEGTWRTALAFRVGKDVTPKGWGKAGCPDDRFGTPTFTKPAAKGAVNLVVEQ